MSKLSGKSMRIAIDIRGLAKPNQGGVGEYTLEILRALFEIAPEHDFVLFSTGTEITRRHVLNNLNLIDIERFRTHVRHLHHLTPNKQINLSIAAKGEPQLDKLIQKESDSCDVFFFPNLNFISVADTPYVVMVHDLSWKIFPHFFTTKDQAWHRSLRPSQVINDAKTVLVPSESTRQDLVQELNTEAAKIQVIPHGIKHETFHAQPLATDHGIRSQYKLSGDYLFYLGTVEPRKNIDALLDAFSVLSKNYPELHLVIAGGPGWRSKKLLERFPSEERVHYLGYIPHDHRAAIMRGAKTMIFPAIYEGFGLPVLEAMACGVPVVSSHTSSIPELAGGSIPLINPYNSQEITAAVEQIMSSPELRQKIIENGLKQAQEFTWQASAKATLKHLIQATH